MSLRAAIAGLGAIGWPVARALHEGIPSLRLTAIAAGRPEIAARRLAEAGIKAPVVAAAELGMLGDIVIDCAPAPTFRSVAEIRFDCRSHARHRERRCFARGAGHCLARRAEDRANHSGDRRTPRPRRGTCRCRGQDTFGAHDKPQAADIAAWRALSRRQQHRDRDHRSADTDFSGSAREGARGFPANVNVAAALSLAGIGPDRTALEIG